MNPLPLPEIAEMRENATSCPPRFTATIEQIVALCDAAAAFWRARGLLENALDLARATMIAAQQEVIGTERAESIFEKEPFVIRARAFLSETEAGGDHG